MQFILLKSTYNIFFPFTDMNKTFDVDLHKILHNLYQILFKPPITFSFLLEHPLLQCTETVRAATSWHLVFPSKLPDIMGWHREQLKCSSTVGASLCYRAPLIPLAPQCQTFTPVWSLEKIQISRAKQASGKQELAAKGYSREDCIKYDRTSLICSLT